MKRQYETPSMEVQKLMISRNIAAIISDPDNDVGVDTSNV